MMLCNAIIVAGDKHPVTFHKESVVLGKFYEGPAFHYGPDGRLQWAVMQPPTGHMLGWQTVLLEHAKKQAQLAAKIRKQLRIEWRFPDNATLRDKLLTSTVGTISKRIWAWM